MTIIGIGHRARTGKDAIADHLVRIHDFRRRAFADSLKTAAMAVFGWDHEHVYGSLKETVDPFWDFSPRWALQKMGTEAMRRNIADDVWVKSLRRHLIDNPWPNWVIPDVRFPNEAKAIKSWGGVVWRVDRPGVESVGDHASETSMDAYDRWDDIIVNDSSLEELYARVNRLL